MIKIIYGLAGWFTKSGVAAVNCYNPGQKVQVRKGFEQASAIGGALICNRVLEVDSEGMNMKIESVLPQDHLRESFIQQLDQWKQTRNYFKTLTAARQ
ncbi:hypothetical protein LWM68_22355 [Niabella sp. W65]|nr:hypothetical protein [Niabella sp. W65]MCH7365262.1 hypothetical protein [Niabella sp. W65]ULT41063.1 hypothetical protein KRR40_41250 [Niabella sp. I65]